MPWKSDFTTGQFCCVYIFVFGWFWSPKILMGGTGIVLLVSTKAHDLVFFS